MSNKKLLQPKIDVVFKALFREENKDLLGGLLSAILKEKVNVITIDKNKEVEIKTAEEKLGIMDLRAELDGGVQCNIEIQLQPHQYENERILYYWADTYKRQIKRSEWYGKLNKTISVIILDHEIKELKGIEELGTKWHIRDDKTGKRVLTDKLEIVIIELPKAKRIYKKDAKNEISHWMMFLDEPNQEEVEKIMSGNEELKKAWDELQRVSGDETLERIAELRIKGIMDEMAAREYAENERKKNRNGKAEWKSGMEKGRKER